MAADVKCWQADPVERWRLTVSNVEEAWIAVAYDRTEKKEAFRQQAADADEAKEKARRFIVGIVPPITFHSGSTLELEWVPCAEAEEH